MTAIERREAILDVLCVRRKDQVKNLAVEFGVSEKTIRTDLEVLGCSYPIETVRGRYGGGVQVADWYHRGRKYLSPEQADLLKRIAPSLEGSDLEILNSILNKFAPYQ
jgi:predicted DNA-binding transcriptional regulator YafY